MLFTPLWGAGGATATKCEPLQQTQPKPRFLEVVTICLISLASCLSGCDLAQVEPFPTITPSPTPSPTAAATATPTPTPSPPLSACPLVPLGGGQHISARGSYTETQTEAAGPVVCRIERDSCAYGLMVGNLAPSIVFKQEETPPYNEEDILMHPAMLLPLYRLDELVAAEWAGVVRLRVTDAYDSLLEHDLGQPDQNRRASLHFEGRAIDLTTWPIDPTLYGRLCALAHCAGFDWVQHEWDHCHAAIRADSLCSRCSD